VAPDRRARIRRAIHAPLPPAAPESPP